MSRPAPTPNAPSLLQTLRATVTISLSLAGVVCGLTTLYLGMRSVMEIGGACADGGPFVPAVRCPEGVPFMIMGGIWGAIIMLGIYVWQTMKHRVPSFLAFSWSALFLSLGWNFLEFGIDPPYGEGLVWGWLVCAILFGLMGGIPLVFAVKPVFRNFFDPKPEPERVKPLPVGQMKARLASRPKKKKGTPRGKPGPAPAGTPKSAWATLRDMGTPSAGAAAASTPGADGEETEAESMVAALERLQYLHRSGALSDAEFAAAKARIIEGEQ